MIDGSTATSGQTAPARLRRGRSSCAFSGGWSFEGTALRLSARRMSLKQFPNRGNPPRRRAAYSLARNHVAGGWVTLVNFVCTFAGIGCPLLRHASYPPLEDETRVREQGCTVAPRRPRRT